MQKIKNKKELILLVSKETGFTVEKVKFVIKDFESNLRYFMANPLLFKGGVRFENFIYIYPRKIKFRNILRKLKKKFPNTGKAAMYKEYVKKYIDI